METLFQDIRYGFRMLAKSPAFTAVAVLTLALGIGANTAMFTFVNALMLKSLPVKSPQELVIVGDPALVNDRQNGTPETNYFSYPLYRELRDNNEVFSGLLAAGSQHHIEVDSSSVGGASDEVISGRLVSGNYFSVLGVDAAAGRLLTTNDDTAENANPVLVLTYGYWQRKFALSPAIIGKEIRLNGYPFTVVGVTQPNFRSDVVGDQIDVFVPITMQQEIIRGTKLLKNPNASWLSVIGRLKPGITVEQAKANLTVVLQQALKGSYGASITEQDRKDIAQEGIKVAAGGSGLSEFRGDYETPLFLLMGIVGLVLLIACVNVANLLLARATARSKEIAVRLALGASRGRLLRQLLTESILLALCGGACGALLAIWGVRLLVKVFGSGDAASLPMSPDVRVLVFTSVVCILTGIMFGLVPSLRSLKVQVSPTLKDSSAAAREPRSRLGWGKGLVAGQVALSLLVLFAASLLVRSLQKLLTQNLGYDSGHIIVASVSPSAVGFEGERFRNLATQLADRLATIPGVRGVSYSRNGILSGSETNNQLIVPGFTSNERQGRDANEDEVGDDYFDIMGVPILLGRAIGPQDTLTSTRVAVINQAMMKHFFHSENPLGRQFEIDDPKEKGKPFTVIGVSKDTKDHGYFLREAVPPRFYFAFQQDATPLRLVYELSTQGDPNAVLASVRKVIKDAAPELPLTSVHTVRQNLEQDLDSQIVLARLSTFFAGLALLLACVGLYGIMSYAVAGRTREIGVRIALGAGRTDVLELVLKEGMWLVGVGLALGIPISLAGGRLLHSFLFGMRSTDPISLLLVIALLSVVAAAAALVPARRATKVDPVVALRYE
ncbi:MAG TPA: ABC transporter permease [Terriglobales bacterium]|nr:ABC transporter permease [Terriglobales bacterium]